MWRGWVGVGWGMAFDRAPLVSATLTGNTWHAVNTVLCRRSNELLNRPVCIHGLRISSVAGQNTTSAGVLSKMQAEPVGQMKGRGGQREAAVKEDGRRGGFKSSAEGVTQQGAQRDREATSSGGVDVTGRSRASHSSVHWWQMMESEPSESREQRRRSSRAKRSSLNSQLILLPLFPNYERMSVRENVALCLLLLRKQKKTVVTSYLTPSSAPPASTGHHSRLCTVQKRRDKNSKLFFFPFSLLADPLAQTANTTQTLTHPATDALLDRPHVWDQPTFVWRAESH